jgi:hypothetical protein
MKQESTFRIILRSLKRRVNLRTIFVLVLLFSANSYAWFIYNTRVNVGISARVMGWNIIFTAGEHNISQNINYDIDVIFPGMEPFEESISVSNRGETAARLSYEIRSITIMGERFDAIGDEGYAELEEQLATMYPFKIEVAYTVDVLLPGGVALFYLTVTWPFESGDDYLDTYWGNKAYYFHRDNPGEASISIELMVRATQINE